MYTLLQDLQYGARILLKNPGFTVTAVLTLALGIGTNTAIFSVTNALLLRLLPVKEPNELLLVTTFDGEETEHSFSYPLYEQLRTGSRNFGGFFAASDVSRSHVKIGETETESIRTQEVTGNFFPMLGVPARLGRMLTTDDDRFDHPQPVAVISHGFWQRRFDSDPAVIGKMVIIEDQVRLTIVGVTPPGFFGVQPGEHLDLWWPLQMMLQVVSDRSRQELKNDGGKGLNLMGRLPAGINQVQAQAEFDLIFQRHWAEFIKRNAAYWADLRQVRHDRKLELQPGAAGYTELRRQFRHPLLLLTAAVGLVLLIVCANVASLTLARAAARQREFMVRSALGAGRLRLIRQLLTESLLVAGLGGLLGVGLVQWGTQALLTLMRIQVDPVSFNVELNARVLLFMLAASLLTGLLFGLVPAIHGSRLDLASALKGAAGTVAGNPVGQRFNQALVVAQVALSVVLLVGAGLLVRTLVKLNSTDAGFDRENVVVFDLDFTHRVDEARRAALYQELSARLETLPGVSAASMSSTFPLSGNTERHMIRVEGYTDHIIEGPNCDEIMISPGFFETTGTPLLGGRGIGRQDAITAGSSTAGAPLPAVINQVMARRFFGQAQPLGRRFYCKYEPKMKFEVVGVVKDVRYQELREPAFPAYYIPFFQDQKHNMEMTFALRTTVDAGALIPGLRRIAQSVDPMIQLRDVRSLNEMVNISLQQERALAQLSSFFSVFALALACLGLYGVLSISVVQRTREIGVRIALGAQRKDVLILVIGRGLKLVLIGLALGLVAAWAVTRYVASLLYGVTATDPGALIGVTFLVLVAGSLACWIPARRATKADPMLALRAE
jgi:predicted permease